MAKPLKETYLLFFVLIHFSQSQEVFDEEHEVNSAQSS